MHDLLFRHQDTLTAQDLVDHASTLGLDSELVAEQLRTHRYWPRVTRDIDTLDGLVYAALASSPHPCRRRVGSVTTPRWDSVVVKRPLVPPPHA